MLTQNRPGGRLGHRPFSVAVRMQARDSRVGGGSLGGLRKIFVAIEADRYSDF